MRAIEFDGRGGIAVVDRPEPRPGPGEVVIAPEATGVCGTDLHLLHGEYAVGRYPVVPGHEFAGHVTAVGAGVRGVTEGDFVGVDPNVADGTCRWCAAGAPNLCSGLLPIGVAVDGSCAERVVVPAKVVYRLPEALDASTGALVEPLSCVLHAAERAPGWSDRTVLVYGAGSIGLLATTLALRLGAAAVHVVEPHAVRRDLALRLGAASAAADAGVLDLGEGVDVVLDASGVAAAIEDGLGRLGRRGTFIQMGVASAAVRVRRAPLAVYEKELTIIGSNSVAGAYGAACDLMVDLRDTVRPLVTHRVPLSSYADAVRRAASPDAIKIHIVPDP